MKVLHTRVLLKNSLIHRLGSPLRSCPDDRFCGSLFRDNSLFFSSFRANNNLFDVTYNVISGLKAGPRGTTAPGELTRWLARSLDFPASKVRPWIDAQPLTRRSCVMFCSLNSFSRFQNLLQWRFTDIWNHQISDLQAIFEVESSKKQIFVFKYFVFKYF